MRFYLGTHMLSWIGRTDVPLFISRHRLIRQRSWHRATGPWALDSGGFTTLSTHGHYTITDKQWAMEVRHFSEVIGPPDWVAPLDWMCEPFMLAKTGKTILEHQLRTVASYRTLIEYGINVIPVLQGWSLDDYLRCAQIYEDCGVSLADAQAVGVGSVCRRQSTTEAEAIMRRLAGEGMRLHGFGVKITGLRRYTDIVHSADSMSWSLDARRAPALEGCTHLNCANCLIYALKWRTHLLDSLEVAA